MQIEILRLNHRIGRDARVSTHAGLTARAFGASRIYYSGQKDNNMEESINKVTKNFGGPFEIEHVKDPIKLIEEKKKYGFKIAHLTMYGKNFEGLKKNIFGTKLLVIIGGEKVEPEYYNLADYNLSITNQPISELSALGVFLYNFFGYKDKFTDSKIIVIGAERGKLLKKL